MFFYKEKILVEGPSMGGYCEILQSSIHSSYKKHLDIKSSTPHNHSAMVMLIHNIILYLLKQCWACPNINITVVMNQADTSANTATSA